MAGYTSFLKTDIRPANLIVGASLLLTKDVERAPFWRLRLLLWTYKCSKTFIYYSTFTGALYFYYMNDYSFNISRGSKCLSFLSFWNLSSKLLFSYHDGHSEDWGKYLGAEVLGGRIVAVKLLPRSIDHSGEPTSGFPIWVRFIQIWIPPKF